MSRIVWLIAFAGLSCVACSGSGNADITEPAPESDDAPAATEASEPSRSEPGSASFSEGPDGLVLESRDAANNPSAFRCERSCSSICSSCLFEACLARGTDPDLCRGARATCGQSCLLTCPQGVGERACYAPCLKGEPTCFIELGLVLDEDPPRPEVLPGAGEGNGQQTRPEEEAQPASEGSSSSSSSSGNNGRPSN